MVGWRRQPQLSGTVQNRQGIPGSLGRIGRFLLRQALSRDVGQYQQQLVTAREDLDLFWFAQSRIQNGLPFAFDGDSHQGQRLAGGGGGRAPIFGGIGIGEQRAIDAVKQSLITSLEKLLGFAACLFDWKAFPKPACSAAIPRSHSCQPRPAPRLRTAATLTTTSAVIAGRRRIPFSSRSAADTGRA